MSIDLHHAAPALDVAVAARAQTAYTCSAQHGHAASRLIVIDMNLPSSTNRLWAFDLRDPKHPTLIVRSRVAHGAGSDPDDVGLARRFGNAIDSGMTSLGLYRVAERFANAQGREAFSLDGLDPGFNDQARPRHVVFHPSAFMPAGTGGKATRSLGCPAVNAAVFERLRDGLEGALLWIDGPDPSLPRAPSLACAAPPKPRAAVCTTKPIDKRFGASTEMTWPAS